MSESEDDIDYIEVLKTINEKNLFLQNQEQNIELKNKYAESFKKYWELRILFQNMRDEFEINQLQMYKSRMLLVDSRKQHKTQMMKLEEYNEKSEFLRKKSIDQQAQFESTVKQWNNKINELSTILDEKSLLLKIQNGQSNIESLLKQIELIQDSHIEDEKSETKQIDYNFEGLKILTYELMQGTKDYEEKLKNSTELETEINEYGTVTDDIQKQLHGN